MGKLLKNKKAEMSGGAIGALVTTAIVLIFIIILIAASLESVPAGHIGVSVDGAKIGDWEDSGYQWFNIMSDVEYVQINTQEITETVTIRTQNNIVIYVDLTLVYHVEKEYGAELRIENGENWRDVTIKPMIREVPRKVATNFSEIEMLTKIELYKEAIRSEMEERLILKHIVLEDLLLRDMEFQSQDVDEAFDKVVIAEQDRIAASFELDAQRIRAEQRVAIAEAEANATIWEAIGQAKSLDILVNQTKQIGNLSAEDVVNYILTLRWYAALRDPNSNVQFVIVPEGGMPMFMNLEDMVEAIEAETT